MRNALSTLKQMKSYETDFPVINPIDLHDVVHDYYSVIAENTKNGIPLQNLLVAHVLLPWVSGPRDIKVAFNSILYKDNLEFVDVDKTETKKIEIVFSRSVYVHVIRPLSHVNPPADLKYDKEAVHGFIRKYIPSFHENQAHDETMLASIAMLMEHKRRILNRDYFHHGEFLVPLDEIPSLFDLKKVIEPMDEYSFTGFDIPASLPTRDMNIPTIDEYGHVTLACPYEERTSEYEFVRAINGMLLHKDDMINIVKQL